LREAGRFVMSDKADNTMPAFLLSRVLQAVGLMLLISVFVFLGVNAIGNPIDVLIGQDVTEQMRQDAIRSLGLDQPLFWQYVAFAGRFLHGDFGQSFVFNLPVMTLIMQRLPATLELTAMAMAIAIGLGIPLGILAGYKPHSVIARLIMAASIIGFSMPSFWFGLVLILTFAVDLGWLPPGGRGETIEIFGVGWSFLTLDGLSHLLLPAINLSLFKLSLLIRLARAGTREIMLTDVVKFARATGQSELSILRRHVLRLIAIPMVTVIGLEFGSTLAFAVVTETIFSWPGIGKLIIDSIMSLDRPVMVAYLMLAALLFVLINLIVDIAYAVLDPRVGGVRA